MKENNFELQTIDNDAFAIHEVGESPVVRESTTSETTTLFNAVSGGSEPVKSVLGQTISVTDIVITGADVHEDREDESSKMINHAVAHFFTSDGKHYSTLSNGILRTVKNLLACGIVPTKETPINITFKTVETKKGTAHIFELA